MDKLMSYFPELLVYVLLFAIIFLIARSKEKHIKSEILVVCGILFIVLFVLHGRLMYNSLGELKNIQKEIQTLNLPATLKEAVLEFKKTNFNAGDNAAIVFKQYKSSGWLNENTDVTGVTQKQIIYPVISKEKEKKFEQINGILFGKQLNTDNIALVKEYLEYNKNFLDAYRSLARYKYTYFDVDPKNPNAASYPDLLTIRRACEIFVQKITLDIREGKYDQAISELEEYQKINEIVNFNTHTWLLNSVIGVAVNGLSLAAMEDLIVKKDLTVTQRDRLIKLLSSVYERTKNAMLRAYNNERVAFNVYTERDRVINRYYKNEDPGIIKIIFESSIFKKIYYSYTYRPFLLQEKVFANKQYLKVMKAVSYGCYTKQLRTDKDNMNKGFPSYYLITRLMLTDMGSVTENAFIELNKINETIFKVMLENFRAVKGRYPENIPELKAVSRLKVPLDIIFCGNFKYKKTPSGYELAKE